jgi:hypothetical protein
MQAFECFGMWTIPNTETPAVAGTLRVSSNGELRLSVIGSIGPTVKQDQEEIDHPVILGTAKCPLGNTITLTKCTLTRKTFGSSVSMSEEYSARRGFFGAHLSEPSDFLFRRLQLRVEGLRSWAHSLSGFREESLFVGGASEKVPLLFYSRPGPISGKIPGGEILLGFTLISSHSLGAHNFSEEPGLVLTFDRPLSEDEITDRYIYPLQNLMTFVCDRAQDIEQISLWHEDILAPRSENPEIRLIGARVYPEAGDEPSADAVPSEPLFTIADLDDRFESFMERWLRLTADYADACNIFFGLQYGPPAYLDIVFLGVLQSLCLYYLRRKDGIAHRSEQEQRLTEILSRLPFADAELLRSLIWDQPFPPLKEILARLIAEHAEIMMPLLVRTQSEFIDSVTNTLNYKIRRDPGAALVAYQGADLYWMTVKLQILLKLCFLREVGFPAEQVRLLYGRNESYQRISRLVLSQRAEPHQ